MMPFWYYAGRVTTPINIPGQGPIVLKPRSRFHAPQSAVAHLLRTKPPLVTRLPDPPQKAEASTAEAKPAPAVAPVPEVPPSAADKSGGAQAAPPDGDDHAARDGVEPKTGAGVVVSSPASAEAEEGSAGEGEGTSSVSEESERRPRRGRSRERE